MLARQLRVVLDQALVPDVGALSDDPEGQLDDGLPARRDLVGRLDTGKGYVSVFLDRVPRDADTKQPAQLQVRRRSAHEHESRRAEHGTEDAALPQVPAIVDAVHGVIGG